MKLIYYLSYPFDVICLVLSRDRSLTGTSVGQAQGHIQMPERKLSFQTVPGLTAFPNIKTSLSRVSQTRG